MAGIIEEDQIAMVNAFDTNGLDGLKQMIINSRDKWEKIPVRIAVTGNSGVGKSSFINTFRGLEPKAPGAAGVGTTETTIEVQAYPHPKNENFVLYDLPGVGTQLFPRESYLQKVDFHKYDFFIILSATRFTENDAWLGQKIKLQQKKFFFVRTKIDNDMDNEKVDSGEDFHQEESLQKIREDAEHNLRGLNAKVFLISNRLLKINQFDFDRLMHDVIKETPKMKTESLVLFLPSLTKNVILEKERVLSNRAFKMAIASGIAGAIPLPGLGSFFDVEIIVREAKFYLEQFNLDEASLKDYKKRYDLDIDQLDLATRSITFTAVGLLPTIFRMTAAEAGNITLKLAIPALVSVIAGIRSYGSTFSLLQGLLNEMKEDALKINGEVAKGLAKSISPTTHIRKPALKGRL